MKTAAIVAATAASLALAGVAGAATKPKTIHLAAGHCARSHGTRICAAPIRSSKTYTRAETALARAETAVKTAQAQLATLQATNAQLAAQRDAATAQAASLQAQINAIPAPLSVAVEQVRREVAWAQGGTTVQTDAPNYGALVSEAAMDYVVGHVSTAAYGYLEALYGETAGGPDLPPYSQDVNTTLATQTGICGHAGRVFAAIVTRFGLQVRGVNFGYLDPGGSPDGHFAVEVYYAGGWHFFDPTFGKFWTDATGNVLSIADVRATGGTLVKDNTLFANLIQDAAYPGSSASWFETDPATAIAYVDASLFVS